jgi:hypothetical protein
LSQADASGAEKALVKTYKLQVEDELKDTCDKVVDILQKLIKPDDDEAERQVFYSKMAGDYYRYLAECTDNGKQAAAENAKTFYAKAYKIAQANLTTTHPIRLGLALNFSVCYYEIIGDHQKACELAKEVDLFLQITTTAFCPKLLMCTQTCLLCVYVCYNTHTNTQTIDNCYHLHRCDPLPPPYLSRPTTYLKRNFTKELTPTCRTIVPANLNFDATFEF